MALAVLEAIVQAAVECPGRNPDASLSEITRAAGAGRVTLYAHVTSRAEVVDAAMSRALDRRNEAPGAVDLTGDPLLALEHYIDTGRHQVDQAQALLVAARRELPAGHIRQSHAGPAARAEALIARRRAEDAFRADLPAPRMAGERPAGRHA
ncbi:TetR/AcrR family transcriptional regulator [Streptomyces sp. ME03-5709C]|nr:TetR/AcrR family transcriptional regulator [Streptomyces sp. ME03-5709C]